MRSCGWRSRRQSRVVRAVGACSDTDHRLTGASGSARGKPPAGRVGGQSLRHASCLAAARARGATPSATARSFGCPARPSTNRWGESPRSGACRRAARSSAPLPAGAFEIVDVYLVVREANGHPPPISADRSPAARFFERCDSPTRRAPRRWRVTRPRAASICGAGRCVSRRAPSVKDVIGSPPARTMTRGGWSRCRSEISKSDPSERLSIQSPV